MTYPMEDYRIDEPLEMDDFPADEDICTGDCSDCPNGNEEGECTRE